MNRKHVFMFLLLSLILISLSSISAEDISVNSDITVEDTYENNIDNSDSLDNIDTQCVSKDKIDSVKDVPSQTHYIRNTDDWNYFSIISQELTGTHTVELNQREFTVENELRIFNDDLELIFNGNGNQLTLHDYLEFNVKNVTFNNLIIDFDNNLETRDIIYNYGNMTLNNVTFKNTEEYNYMVNVFKEKGYYEFDDWDGVEKTFSYSTRHGNINNNGELFVNDCLFKNNSGHMGTSIYNDGRIYVENTVFEDSIGEFGIVYSNNEAVIKNCEFKNNRVFQQLILVGEDSELINNTFTGNIIAGGAIIDNRASINIKDCELSSNKAKYELIDNWVYMDASNLKLYDNTCETLINSFGNLTLKNSFIKDNTCSDSIICRNTLYVDIETNEVDKAGNVTLINNKIFRGNVGRADFFNNPDTGKLSLYNNTIYDNPDYAGDCIFDGNTFVADKNLYDDEGNYHGQKREMEIGHYINYEIVNREYQSAILSLDPISLKIGENCTIIGFLKDINNNGITNQKVSLYIYDPDNNVTVYDKVTGQYGKFNCSYTPAIPGNYTVHASYDSDDYYDSAETEIVISVDEKQDKYTVNTSITLDPILEKYQLGEEIIISGTLTDINNNPLVHKKVYIITDGGKLEYRNNYLHELITDENGCFNLTIIPEDLGEINIEAYYNSYNEIYNSSSIKVSSYIYNSSLIDTTLTMNPIKKELVLTQKIIISGNLTDMYNNPLSNKNIEIQLDGGESDFGIYSYTYNTTTDENGVYYYPYTLRNEGAMTITVFFRNDTTYSFSYNISSSYVYYYVAMASLDSMNSTINLGDSVTISGNLTYWINDDPIPNETLRLNLTYDNSEKSIIEYVNTDEDGIFVYNYTPDRSGKLNIKVLGADTYIVPVNDANITILDNGSEPINNSSETTDNKTDDNSTNNNQTSDDEQNIDNTNNSTEDTRKDINPKTHGKIVKTVKTHKKPVIRIPQKKLSDKIILKIDRNVTLSWLNDIFKDDFKNKTLLIYIDDILVFNGTVSDNPSEVLFKVIEKYEGEHLLKVVVGNDTYQKEVTII